MTKSQYMCNKYENDVQHTVLINTYFALSYANLSVSIVIFLRYKLIMLLLSERR